jgi:hypothetical protein
MASTGPPCISCLWQAQDLQGGLWPAATAFHPVGADWSHTTNRDLKQNTSLLQSKRHMSATHLVRHPEEDDPT